MLCVQREQAQAVQSLHDAKQRLARQVQVIQADRDRYKKDSEQEHKELLQAAETQQHLQEQIRSGITCLPVSSPPPAVPLLSPSFPALSPPASPSLLPVP